MPYATSQNLDLSGIVAETLLLASCVLKLSFELRTIRVRLYSHKEFPPISQSPFFLRHFTSVGRAIAVYRPGAPSVLMNPVVGRNHTKEDS
jgi:hypothetical protein